MTITVLICDDDPTVRTALTGYLTRETGVRVVRAVATAEAALEAAGALRPDVVLMDLVLPGMDGIEATRRLRARARGPVVVVLTTFGTEEQVSDAIHAGATGFLLKSSTAAVLIAAVQAAAAKAGTVITPELATHLASAAARDGDPARRSSPSGAAREHAPESAGLQTDTTKTMDMTNTADTRSAAPAAVATGASPEDAHASALACRRLGLTDRERDVLELVCAAESNAGIARTLSLSESTVKSHVGSVMNKLGCASRLQVAVRAFELGLVPPPRRRD